MKGPEDLLDQNKKQIEYLQRQCRKAGKAILDLEAQKISLKKGSFGTPDFSLKVALNEI